MAVKTKQPNLNTVYFCTFTCLKWLPLFEQTQAYDAIYKWFDYMLEKYENRVVGYVTMPNHLHVLLYLTDKSPAVNRLIGNGKRFLSYEIVRRLEKQGDAATLRFLQQHVREYERKRGKKHSVFETSFDAKECVTEEFFLQKLTYIHNNPLGDKWRLAETPEAYPHSSARWYIQGEHSAYPVFDYREEF